MKSLSLHVPISKLDEEQRMVYGYASTPQLDSQGDRITVEALEKALPGYMAFANIREMHQPIAVGKTKSARVDEGGLYIGAKIVDDAAWTKVKEGVYSAFSIGGFINTKKGDTISDLDLVEISLVDRPANPGATIDIWKSERPVTNHFWWAHRLPVGKTITLTDLLNAMKKNDTPVEEEVVETPVAEPVVEAPVEVPVETPAEAPADVPAEEVKEEVPVEPATPEEVPAEPASEKKQDADITKMVAAAVAKEVAPLRKELADLKEQVATPVVIKTKAPYATVEKNEPEPKSEAQTKLEGLMKRHGELLELRKSLTPAEYERQHSAEAQKLMADIAVLRTAA